MQMLHAGRFTSIFRFPIAKRRSRTPLRRRSSRSTLASYRLLILPMSSTASAVQVQDIGTGLRELCVQALKPWAEQKRETGILLPAMSLHDWRGSYPARTR